MKFKISKEPIVQVWVEYPELQEIHDSEDDLNLWCDITEEIYLQAFNIDGIVEIDEMNDCFKCEYHKVDIINKKINKLVIPSAIRVINIRIQNCEDDFQDEYVIEELKQLKSFKKLLTKKKKRVIKKTDNGFGWNETIRKLYGESK
jgi:hypothetical protein